MSNQQNQIDHVALVVDASGSMNRWRSEVVKVVDGQVAYLAQRSKDLNREVRISVYSFGTKVECLIFDKDVLRMPSIRDLYKIGDMTALIDATMKSQIDLDTTSTIYGDHAFLTFVITDGFENASRRFTVAGLGLRLAGQPDNYTVAALVPDHESAHAVSKYGFPADNVRTWDATSAAGVAAAGSAIQVATDNFMAGRQAGVRSSRTVFSTGADAVNKQAVKAALTPLAGDKYRLIPVMPDGVKKGDKVRVDKFIRDDCGMKFQIGTVYYQWNKRESVQPQKRLAVVEKKTDRVFVGTGDEIRAMTGMGSMLFKDKPTPNPDFDIYVQSTAPNRNLVPFTKVLVML